MMPTERLRVAICGGGIAGLSLAVTLGKYSQIVVDVYESAQEISTVGAGLVVWKRTWEVMRQLGLDVEMTKRGISHPSDGQSLGMILRRSDQPAEGCEINRLVSQYSPIPLHRAALIDMLRSRLSASCTIHTSKTLTTFTQSSPGRYILQFGDETTSEADVLVGADGVRSVVRRVLFNDMLDAGTASPGLEDGLRQTIEPQWPGTMVYRTLIKADKLREIYPTHPVLTTVAAFSYSGKGKHIIAYPIAQHTLINVLAFDTHQYHEGKALPGRWVSDCPKDEVVERYKGWEPQVQAMLDSMEPTTSRWAVHVCGKMPLCVHGNVALIGDAVHAMTTNASAGAGQAIEDAYILGRLLASLESFRNVTSINKPELIATALRIYQDTRLSVAQDIVARSRELGMLYEFNGPAYDGADRADENALEQWREEIAKRWEFQWTGSPEDDWARAEKQLEEAFEEKRSE